MTDTLIDTLLTRRSVVARDLCDPGPNESEVKQILAAGHRVPDHGKIGPWRFIIFQNEARATFGQHLADIFAKENPTCGPKVVEFEKERFTRAPLVIAVISSPIEHKVPQWEQELSSGAVCQNMLLAAKALGYGAQWLTEWYAFNKEVDALLSLKENEKVAGFIYIGNYRQAPQERNRPDLNERVSYWNDSESL
ncbi:nitroreductase family protein [Agarilytica rhodophyticola]|uniref:nitroreductase family protein n=1 Tax=Agarilytica rhodophyticola TaxID=1737490 RepID=UPI000B341EA9|nr:nitroreductase [Agarilytica rhodophyticola]